MPGHRAQDSLQLKGQVQSPGRGQNEVLLSSSWGQVKEGGGIIRKILREAESGEKSEEG